MVDQPLDSSGASLLGNFWTPLVALGCSAGPTLNAQISVSVFGASIVPERPRLLCVIYKSNYTHDLVQAKGSFTICPLSADQMHLIAKLGFSSGRDGDKIGAEAVEVTKNGNPIFLHSLGWLECSAIDQFDLGDATAFLGAVTGGQRFVGGEPMTWAKARPTLPREWLETWDKKIAGEIERSKETMKFLRPGPP